MRPEGFEGTVLAESVGEGRQWAKSWRMGSSAEVQLSLVRIQAESLNPMIDGGWMRGFDYALWEYYGSNADQFWTAYCMETGWSNAIIDIALALYLLDDSVFEPRKK